ncbi:hypothetical protein K32_24540 [Kaistia sp. 32K]|uniref:hypothetical protein n=1 Tax=Kaistia sp. 32K TaxID=2795690 RepID=UPI001914E9E9|nr:hypothetical protein [Kaistia sp. 32K]BCP53837.1 hypothetical protein K32_24540 [Kaistia sp. 32K]
MSRRRSKVDPDLFEGVASRVLHRKLPEQKPITLDRLKHARRLAARLLLMDGEAARPIFEMLDREVQEAERKIDNLARVRAIANGA